MNDKVIILVCSHKADSHIRNYGVYKAIQVGKALKPDLDLGYLRDDVGDNISSKNPRWCELTAIYWGWKNISDVEYVGLAHYRRYFNLDITEDNIESIIGNHDVILGNPLVFDISLQDYFIKWTTPEDYYLLMDTLLYLYPDCKASIEKYILNGNKLIPFTMLLCRKELYDDFCSFVFPLFSELEAKLKSHGYSRLNRFIAFSGELLLGLWADYKKLDILYSSVVFNDIKIEIPRICKIKNIIKFKLTHLRKRKFHLVIPEFVSVGYNCDGIQLQCQEFEN